MSEKKRKRDGQEKQRPRKRVATASSAASDSVKLSVLQDVDDWTPLLVSTPGITLPPDTSFKPYAKPRADDPRSSTSRKELLLHSATHPKLDYVGREEDTEEDQGLRKHYIGVYNPATETLQLVPTKKLIIRSTLHSSARPEQSVDDQHGLSQDVSARTALGLEFGTKKSKKAIRALTENAISPSKNKTAAQDAAANAIMDSVAASTADMPTRDDLQAEAMSNKPIPTPNLEATTVAEVYTIDSLVGVPALRSMQVKEWMEIINSGEEITTRSRFVSARVAKLVKADKVKELKALKYLLLLVVWYASLNKTKGGLRVPKKEEWDNLMPGWGMDTITAVGRKFADDHMVNKWHANLLLTHVLAIALVIDNHTLDVHDIRDDLHMDNKEISTLYAELGAPLSAPTEADLKRLQMTKTEAQQTGRKMARLRLPLQFPKLRMVTNKGSRR